MLPTAPALPDGLPTPVRHYAVATVLCGIAMTVIDSSVMNLALPVVARDLQVSASMVIWVVNAYQIATLALLLPLARLGDLYGYRKVYLSGLALFTLASLACVLARSLEQLIAARVLQGLGGAGMFAINAALVRAIYPRRLLGRGIAINSMVVAVSSVAGPPVAALVLSVATWPWLFAINLPIGLLVLLLGLRSLPADAAAAAQGQRLPLRDVAMNIAMFGAVFVGVDQLAPRGGHAGLSASALATLGFGLAIGAVYVRRQRRQAVPLLPIDLLRIPVFRLSMCASIAAFTAQMLAFVALPFLLLQGLGRSPADAGLVLVAWPIATLASAPVAGRLIGRVPSGLLGGVGMAMMAAGLAAMAWLPENASLLQMVWRLALCGAGFGLFQSPNNHTIVTAAPLARSGAAGGMLGTARLTGQTTGALLLATLFSLSLVAHQQVPQLALAIAAIFALAAGGASLLRLRAAGVANDELR